MDLSVPHHRLALGLGALALLVATAGAVSVLRRRSNETELGLLEPLGSRTPGSLLAEVISPAEFRPRSFR